MGDAKESEVTTETGQPKDVLSLGENNLVFTATDGYGLCLGVALENYLTKLGKKVTLHALFPANSPRNFWAGRKPTVSSLPALESYDQVYILGIPFNNWSGQTFKESTATYQGLTKGVKVMLANNQYTREDLHITDVPDFSRLTEATLEELEEQYSDGVNLVHLARFAIKDSSVLDIVADPKRIEFYETLALGVEVASRASLKWHRQNKKDQKEFRAALEAESNKRIQTALKRLRARDWNYFVGEAEKFRRGIEIPTVTLPPIVSGDRKSTFAFIEVETVPLSFHLMTMEEIAVRTGADYVIAARYNPLLETEKLEESPFTLKVVKNWKRRSPSINEVIEQKKRDSDVVTGSKRLTTIKVTSGFRLAEFTKDILLALDPELNSVFEGTNVIAVLGDPNTGKSSVCERIERYCNLFFSPRKLAKRLDRIDRVGWTPDFFLRALYKLDELEAREIRGQKVGKLIARALRKLNRAIEKRNKGRASEWTEQMLQEARKELDGLPDNQIFLVDMPGGIPQRGVQGKIIDVKREVPQVVYFLESPTIDGVFILGKSEDEISAWQSIVTKINEKRKALGLPAIKVVGDAITSPVVEPFAYADYPKKPVRGRIPQASRKKITQANSVLFLLSSLISSMAFEVDLK